jgi:hypothetical protein
LAGTNKPGYSSIFVMPASLFTATVFSEAMWQRAWASADRRCGQRGTGWAPGALLSGASGKAPQRRPAPCMQQRPAPCML